MSENIQRSHNVSNIMYHFVCPTKYRKIVIDEEVDEVLKGTCLAIQDRYDIFFLEIGTDKDHVHFLVQSVPALSPSEIIGTIKSITAKRIFKECPKVKKKLWGGNFWSAGFYVSTVSEHGNEKVIANYVKRQGDEYSKMHRADYIEGQMSLSGLI